MRFALAIVTLLAGVVIGAIFIPEGAELVHKIDFSATEPIPHKTVGAGDDKEHSGRDHKTTNKEPGSRVNEADGGHQHADEAPNGSEASRDGGHDPEDGHPHEERAEGEAGHAEEGVVRMPADKAMATEIHVEEAKSGKIARRIIAPGVIVANPERLALVPVKVVGTVVEMRKRLGEDVAANEVVAVLDSREVADLKSDYLTAIVNFDLQETNFSRAKTLWDKRISAEAQFLEAQATYTEAKLRADLSRQKLVALAIDPKEVEESSKSDLNAGKSSLRRYEVKSLVGGRVIERKVEVGSSVGQDNDPKELYRVADLSTVWVELSIPTGSLEGIREGQTVTVVGTGNSAPRGTGKIVFISPVLDPETRSARVIADIANPDATWRPGSYVTAFTTIDELSVAVQVPRTSVQLIDGKEVVFVRTEAGFEKREVTLGKGNEDRVEIIAGLRPGEMVASKNTFLLKAELGKSEAEHSH